MTRVEGLRITTWYPRLTDAEHRAYVRDMLLGTRMVVLLRALGVRL